MTSYIIIYLIEEPNQYFYFKYILLLIVMDIYLSRIFHAGIWLVMENIAVIGTFT